MFFLASEVRLLTYAIGNIRFCAWDGDCPRVGPHPTHKSWLQHNDGDSVNNGIIGITIAAVMTLWMPIWSSGGAPSIF